MHRHEGHDACHAGTGDILARAEALCRERGLQFTPLRREVLEAVAEAGKAQGAYDIAERLSAPGKRVAPVSVYRALDFLMDQGLVHRIASRNAFIPCAHGHAPGEGVIFDLPDLRRRRRGLVGGGRGQPRAHSGAGRIHADPQYPGGRGRLRHLSSAEAGTLSRETRLPDPSRPR